MNVRIISLLVNIFKLPYEYTMHKLLERERKKSIVARQKKEPIFIIIVQAFSTIPLAIP